MKKLLQCLGTAVISIIAGYLMYLLCLWITPIAMRMGWLLVIVLVIVGIPIFSGIISAVGNLLSVPIVLLVEKNMVAKIINVIPLLYFGICAVRIPWSIDIEYELLQNLIAISLTISYIIVFGNFMIMPFFVDNNK